MCAHVPREMWFPAPSCGAANETYAHAPFPCRALERKRAMRCAASLSHPFQSLRPHACWVLCGMSTGVAGQLSACQGRTIRLEENSLSRRDRTTLHHPTAPGEVATQLRGEGCRRRHMPSQRWHFNAVGLIHGSHYRSSIAQFTRGRHRAGPNATTSRSTVPQIT